MKKITDSLAAALLCGIIGVLIVFSHPARTGASNGMRLCEDILLPSLLPLLIIANMLTLSRGRLLFERLLGGVCERVLHLPRCCAAAVVLGLTAGYPAGAMLTQALYESRTIDEKTAAAMMRFNFSGGLAFTVTAVGTVCRGSTRAGVILFACQTLAALLYAFGNALMKRKTPCRSTAVGNGLALPDALTAAVEKTVESLMVMCANIVLFSALTAILRPPAPLLPLLEITAGLCSSAQQPPLPLCAFYLSFGGLCIHLQLFGILRRMRVGYLRFLTGRILCSLLSFCLCSGYLRLFPAQAEVFSNLSSPAWQFSQGGAALSVVMMLGCAVVVFEIENRKSQLI